MSVPNFASLPESKGAEEHHVTRDGQVICVRPGQYFMLVRKLDRDLKGYLTIGIRYRGKRFRRVVHRLVAINYLPPRPSPAHQIRHLNGIKTDNRVENLCWGTAAENSADRSRHIAETRRDLRKAKKELKDQQRRVETLVELLKKVLDDGKIDTDLRKLIEAETSQPEGGL